MPFSGTAATASSFAAIPAITVDSVAIIFKVGSPLKSYVPGRSINAISGFEKGAGYYIVPKTDLDLTDYFIKSRNMITLTDAATISWDVAASNVAKVTIAASRGINIINMTDGDTGILTVIHGAGATTITLPGTVADGFAWKTGAGQTTVIGFIFTTAKGFLWTSNGFATT